MQRMIKMAWRNIWRNKRRTLITVASIFFAVFFAIVMRSFQLGTYDHMIQQSIESYSGYLQVQDREYYNDPNLDYTFKYDKNMMEVIGKHENIKVAVPRVESFALASSGNHSKGVVVTGIHPQNEKSFSNPEHRLVKYRLTNEAFKNVKENLQLTEEQMMLLENNRNASFSSMDRIALDLDLSDEQVNQVQKVFERYASFPGEYLTKNSGGVLVSDRLSKFLDLVPGDTLVLMGQGYHGTTAAGLFPVQGIVKIPSPDLDNKLVYMSLSGAQEFFGMPNHVTSIAINLHDIDKMNATQKKLETDLNDQKYIVKNWQELNPTLKQQIEGDNKSGQVFVGLLYLIVFFGIFGTVLMMIAEREREFGVLVAIGMRKAKLSMVVVIEMFFVGLVGTLAGMLASMPLVVYFNKNPYRLTGEVAKMYEDMGFDPVMPMAWIDQYFAWQALIILIMVVVACYIPLNRIRKMKVMNALRA